MNKEDKPINSLTNFLIIFGIIIIGWNLYTGATIQEIGIPGIFSIKFGGKPEPSETKNPNNKNEKPITEVRKYLMDNNPNRIINLTHLQSSNYRIEEPSSPWPWEGTATIDGGQLNGEAKFRNSFATMRVEGVVRGDKSIVVKYNFITGSDGKPAGGLVHNHVWYPSD